MLSLVIGRSEAETIVMGYFVLENVFQRDLKIYRDCWSRHPRLAGFILIKTRLIQMKIVKRSGLIDIADGRL